MQKTLKILLILSEYHLSLLPSCIVIICVKEVTTGLISWQTIWKSKLFTFYLFCHKYQSYRHILHKPLLCNLSWPLNGTIFQVWGQGSPDDTLLVFSTSLMLSSSFSAWHSTQWPDNAPSSCEAQVLIPMNVPLAIGSKAQKSQIPVTGTWGDSIILWATIT